MSAFEKIIFIVKSQLLIFISLFEQETFILCEISGTCVICQRSAAENEIKEERKTPSCANTEPFFFRLSRSHRIGCEGGNRKLMLPFMSLINNKKANDVRRSCGWWDDVQQRARFRLQCISAAEHNQLKCVKLNFDYYI